MESMLFCRMPSLLFVMVRTKGSGGCCTTVEGVIAGTADEYFDMIPLLKG